MPSLINELMLAEVTEVAKHAQAIILIDARYGVVTLTALRTELVAAALKASTRYS